MPNWNYQIFLDEALSQLQKEFKEQNREQEFLMWFNIQYVESKENSVVVSLPSNFLKDQFITRKYLTMLLNKLHELSGQDISVDFLIKPISKHPATNKSSSTTQVSQNIKPLQQETLIIPTETQHESSVPENVLKKHHPALRTDYTFDTFVLGDNNSFAYNAAKAVSKNPGKAYNPMLIYGGVGLGKTHLMQAIGDEIYNNSTAKVIYITAENFTNEFIASINEKRTQKFKNKYRTADVLLIDDIHFLQNKIETQEELFHTFNALYDSYKQIVFTCDRPVSELKNLSDRLRSRFERGLNVDLQPPKYETRRAILEKKLTTMGKHIPDDVLDLIAQNVATNVRDLEACLTKLIAYTELVGNNVTLEIAQQQLRDTFSSPKQANISVDNIQRVVAEYYGISISDIKGKKRSRNITLPRQLSMYIASELTEYSTTELGIEFGGRDHTTVMYSCQKIEEALRSDSTLESTMQLLFRKVKDYKK
jgi:chromosomal replication initiator protein